MAEEGFHVSGACHLAPLTTIQKHLGGTVAEEVPCPWCVPTGVPPNQSDATKQYKTV